MGFKFLKHSEFESKGDTIKPLSAWENRGTGSPGTWKRPGPGFLPRLRVQSELLPPQTAARFDDIPRLFFHVEDRPRFQQVVCHYECEAEDGQGSKGGFWAPSPRSPCPRASPVQSLSLKIFPNNPYWNDHGPTRLGDITLNAEQATRTLPMKVTRGRWRVREEEWEGKNEGGGWRKGTTWLWRQQLRSVRWEWF